jgi:hypothetical protein
VRRVKEDLLAVQRRQRKGIMVLAFVAVALMFLAWRFEVAQDELRRYVHDACMSRAANATRLNTQAREFIEVEKDNPFQYQGPGAQEVIDRRIAIWEDSILDVPVCD